MVSNEAVKKATGKTWDEWFRILDDARANKWPHKQIADWLWSNYGLENEQAAEVHSLSGWWCQGVTVAYEQARGLRALHQQSDGFVASISKTLEIPVKDLFEWFNDKTKRAKWCKHNLEVTTATEPKSLRAKLPDGSRVAVGFYSKGLLKSQVAIQHEKLTDEAAVAYAKAAWKTEVEALSKLARG